MLLNHYILIIYYFLFPLPFPPAPFPFSISPPPLPPLPHPPFSLFQVASNSEQNVHQHRNYLRRIKHENKAAFTILAIVCGYVCCWMPFLMANLVAALTHHKVPYTVDVVSTLLVAVASSVNPLFYAWLDTSFRVAFKRILYPVLRWNSSTQITAVSTHCGEQQ